MWIKEHDKFKNTRFNKLYANFTLFVLCFCLFIILWGAWVRISHSGDGCGLSWPSCDGQYIITHQATKKTWIEWTHRFTSGLFGLFVLALLIKALFYLPSKHPARKSALLVFIFTVTEALIGARLVLKGLTGSNTSIARLLTMNLHMLNSILLTGSLFRHWQFLKGQCISFKSIYLNKKNNIENLLFPKYKHLICFIIAFFIISLLGSLSSLSASLFPSSSLSEGLLLDFDPGSHWLIRLRLLHPVLAISFSMSFLLYYIQWKNLQNKKIINEKQITKNNFYKDIIININSSFNLLFICVFLAMVSGLLNLLLLSPTFLKLTHLLILHLLVISFLSCRPSTTA